MTPAMRSTLHTLGPRLPRCRPLPCVAVSGAWLGPLIQPQGLWPTRHEMDIATPISRPRPRSSDCGRSPTSRTLARQQQSHRPSRARPPPQHNLAARARAPLTPSGSQRRAGSCARSSPASLAAHRSKQCSGRGGPQAVLCLHSAQEAGRPGSQSSPSQESAAGAVQGMCANNGIRIRLHL
jgi:hypothetical protein